MPSDEVTGEFAPAQTGGSIARPSGTSRRGLQHAVPARKELGRAQPPRRLTPYRAGADTGRCLAGPFDVALPVGPPGLSALTNTWPKVMPLGSYLEDRLPEMAQLA